MEFVEKKLEPIRVAVGRWIDKAIAGGKELEFVKLTEYEAARLFEEGPCYSAYCPKQRWAVLNAMLADGRCKAYSDHQDRNGDYVLFIWDPKETE